MWSFAAETTTDGIAGNIRQCVCGEEVVNFPANFGLPGQPKPCPEGKTAKAGENAGFYL